MIRLCLALGALLPIFVTIGHARPIRMAPPEEMEDHATVVCNGLVLSIEETGLKRDAMFPFVSPPGFHLSQMKARVKVLYAFKGQLPAEFELYYEVLDSAKYPTGMMNAPERISIRKGERCRFFLKPDNGQYLGVLDGALDDWFAVEGLWPHEGDDSPYLKKDEAIKIARDYVASQTHGDKAEGNTNVLCDPDAGGGAVWSVTLHESDDPRSRYCAISVRGDRTVNPDNSKLWDLPR